MVKLKHLTILILLGSINVTNAFSNTTPAKTAIRSGEKLKFVASYYMSSLWVDLAEINTEVSDMKTASQELYRLKFTATTYSSWDSFFKVRDLYESYVDKQTYRPYLFKRSIEEGNYTKTAKYIFKWKQGIVKASVQRRKDPERKLDVSISNDTYDIISLFYNIRNINFSTKKIGYISRHKLLFDEKEVIVSIKYSGIETINVAKLGRVKCYKLSILMKDDKVLKGKDSNNIWLTADKNMTPVLIKAEIPVGSIQIRLVDIKG